MNILVVGGAGFVGRHLVAALAARGARVAVPTRRRDRAKHLILLPTVDVIETDLRDPKVLRALAAGRDAVVNLAGVLHGPGFAATHVELAQGVVNACRAAGVKRLIHMSALGADPQAPSEYLRTKGAGERLVLAADDLAATVFRPSVIFGPEDQFLNLFAQLVAWLPAIALGSPDARFQPVYVGDVVKAMLAALESREAGGKRYDLCGPHECTLRELVDYVCAVTGRKRLVVGLPDGLSYLQAWFMELLPVKLLTRDNYLSLKVPSVCDCAFPFGIQPVALEATAAAWLTPSGPRERYPQLRWKAKR
jgi:NADH dehydrogenase